MYLLVVVREFSCSLSSPSSVPINQYVHVLREFNHWRTYIEKAITPEKIQTNTTIVNSSIRHRTARENREKKKYSSHRQSTTPVVHLECHIETKERPMIIAYLIEHLPEIPDDDSCRCRVV
jgi:hypothetical protein